MERVMQKRAAGTITLHGAEQYEFHRPNHGRPVPVDRPGHATIHLYPLTMVLSLCIGAAAVIGVSVALFRIGGQPLTMVMSDLDLAWIIGLGLALAMALQALLRLRSAGQTVMMLVGVVAMTLGQHNMHHWFPGVTAQLFTGDYTAQVRSQTPVNSLQFRGRFVELDAARHMTVAACAAPDC
jgi:hypothetical protein